MIYKITTAGDCEGRSTRDLGIYKGTLDQIITYLQLKGIQPYYGYTAKQVDVVDCTDVTPEVSVTVGEFGSLTVVTSEDFKTKQQKEAALAKLTKEERDLLGL